ncbi:hypothetical protein RND71_023270 [Anisodus tanguticus]|uniref:ACT domain-containing protein ACR n=1 Tax=Anisodus tanguticus TaxID=243964 RepID=A0AAE1RU35_9SOLA|nr:hypothetical protein RND71_023270 [Anisodus tanguticus]
MQKEMFGRKALSHGDFVRSSPSPVYFTVATLMEKIVGPLSVGSLKLASTDVKNLYRVTVDNTSEKKTTNLIKSLGPRGCSFRSLTRSVGVQSAAEHTTIELTGRDRPGLLSEIFAVLTDYKCNVVAAEVWTHNSRMASIVYITDEENGMAIDDTDRLAKLRHLLLYVLKGERDRRGANTAVSVGSTHKERRLHQMMYADNDYDKDDTDCISSDRSKPLVTVENCADKGYTIVMHHVFDQSFDSLETLCVDLLSL